MNNISLNQLRDLIANPPPPSQTPLEPVTEWTVAAPGNEPHDADAELGRRLMASGACGCVLAAGGQGTRLGFHGPKGLYPISVITGKSLFQRLCERVWAAGRQVGHPLSLAIMTSQENDRDTRKFIAKQDHFGLEPGQIEYFVQGSLPMLDANGQPFANGDGSPALGSNGNGAVFAHFSQSGIADRWRDKGIRYVSFIPIDNALADPFDAQFFGFHARSEGDVSMKAMWRENPLENVGVIVRKGGKIEIVEYTEISPAERERRDSNGQYVHRLANLSLFCFSLEFMQRMARVPLPLHVARKTVAGLRGTCQAYKFESFIFDALPFATHTSILVVPRQRCFAALKNREGLDSLATVQADLVAFDRQVYFELTSRHPDPRKPLELSAPFYYPTPALKATLKNSVLPSAGYIDI